MRVTQSMLTNNMLTNLNDSMDRLGTLQDQLSTGKKISRPSQDPVVAVHGMQYRTTQADNTQFRDNTGSASDWLTSTESALGEGKDVLLRVKELVTEASSDTLNQSDRQSIRDELIQLREQLGNVANTNLNGKYIFSGTDTSTPPYGSNGGGVQAIPPGTPSVDSSQLPYAPNVGYTNTNQNDINLELSQGIYIPIGVNGVQIFGQRGKQGDVNTDLFATMDKLINALKPSPYATNDKGQLLAVHAADDTTNVPPQFKKGDQMLDSSGNPVIYDPKDSAQAPLENYAVNGQGQILAAYAANDKANPPQFKKGDPIVDSNGVAVVYNPKDTTQAQQVQDSQPQTGDAISGYLDVVQGHIDNFLTAISGVGARQNRITLIQNRLDTQNTDLDKMLSDGEDADMAKVMTDLTSQQNVHQAALASGARIIQTTLLEYLK
jgi:flagellar hook-associated protein 3 FlgL